MAPLPFPVKTLGLADSGRVKTEHLNHSEEIKDGPKHFLALTRVPGTIAGSYLFSLCHACHAIRKRHVDH